MNINSGALAVMLSGAFLLTAHAASAQTTTPPATATRPSGPEQSSIPSNAPPASTKQTTGQTNQDPTVKEMNRKAKGKVEREGK